MKRRWKNLKKHFIQSYKGVAICLAISLLGGCLQEGEGPTTPIIPRPEILKKHAKVDKKRLTHRVEVDTKTATVRRMVFGQAVIRPHDISKIPNYVVVEAGDTLYKIAGRTGVSMRALIEANELMPPYTLVVGRVLALPKPRVHIVQKGETLQGIAQKWSVPLKTLMELNELTPPYRILPGDELILPAGARKKPQEKKSQKKAVPLAPLPSITPPVTAEKTVPQPPVFVETTAPDEAWQAVQEMIPSLTPSAVPPVVTPATVIPTVKPQIPQKEPPVDTVSPTATPTFGCPLQGKITSPYGAQKGGLYNDGINIAAPEGAEIHAVGPGKVVYIGDQLKGYGQLILIKHKDGWMSAYGHVGKFLVKRGEKIRSGQSIGYVGTTGRVTTPQLHFELRDGVKSVDPVPLLTCHI